MFPSWVKSPDMIAVWTRICERAAATERERAAQAKSIEMFVFIKKLSDEGNKSATVFLIKHKL